MLERREKLRRHLVFVLNSGDEDDLIIRALARSDLLVVDEVGGEAGAHARDPNSFALIRKIVRLTRPQIIRLPRVVDGDLLVTALHREQQITVRRAEIAGDIADGVAA